MYLLYDMYAFYKEGFISKELVDNQYSYFFCIIYNSPEINKYRTKLRNEEFLNAHNFLDDIAKEFNLINKDCKEF